MIKSVVFDIDGTMLDTEQAILRSFRDTLLQREPGRTEWPDMTFALGIPTDTAFRQIGISDVDHAERIWMDLYINRHSRKNTLFNGIGDVIAELKKQGYKLGIVTSKNRIEYNNDFVPLGLGHYFDTVICIEDGGMAKPHPAPMLKYLELSGSKKTETLFIGDSVYDMQCASAAGVQFGWAMWGGHHEKRAHAECYFNAPGDILDALEADRDQPARAIRKTGMP